MAILFGRISNITRGSGQSAVSCAAYRSCSKLTLSVTDTDTNITVGLDWDYSNKKGLVYSHIHAPENAPDWIFDRQTLWQTIEDLETKSNARLAGDYTVALPKEFTIEQNIEFTKELIATSFTSRGVVVDANFHNDNPNNPHVHLMYALRELIENEDGSFDFSTHRYRELQRVSFAKMLKEEHKLLLNKHLKLYGFEQQLEWGTPNGQEATIHHGGIAETIGRNELIIRRNADRIIADPTLVIDRLDFNKPVFSIEDIEKELEKALLTTIKGVPVSNENALNLYIKSELIGLVDTVLLSKKLTLVNPCDLKGRVLFAKTDQIELEKKFIKTTQALAKNNNHALDIKEEDLAEYKKGKSFSDGQKEAIINICSGTDLSVLEGWPGAGKSTVTAEIVRHYKKAGYEIIATAPTNKAAQELEAKIGIKVSTTSSLHMKWQMMRGAKEVGLSLGMDYHKEDLYRKEEPLMNPKTLLVIDEASMLNLPMADYFVSEAKKAGVKVLGLGDNNQNQAIGIKGSFLKMGQIGNYNLLAEVNRHKNSDDKIRELHIEATRSLLTNQPAKAIEIYDQLGKINILDNEEAKEKRIISDYTGRLLEFAKKESIGLGQAAGKFAISAFTNKEIDRLNAGVRNSLRAAGVLGVSHKFVSGGKSGANLIELSKGDRIIFTSNFTKEDKTGHVVINNEFATVKKIISCDNNGVGSFLVDVHGATGQRVEIIHTGQEGRAPTFRHGYAVTNYAVQGADVPYKLYSVDRFTGSGSFLVGLTRHEIDCTIYGAKDTLEDQLYKTKDLDVEKIREEYKAISYERIITKDREGKSQSYKKDVPAWKLGLSLLASKSSDLGFSSDFSYGHADIKVIKDLSVRKASLDSLRNELKIHDDALSGFEDLANKCEKDQKMTRFEILASKHFKINEPILFDIEEVMSSSENFMVSDGKISRNEQIENHITALKSGFIAKDTIDNDKLNWSDLPEKDKSLVLWSYLEKGDKKSLTDHYNNSLDLREEIESFSAESNHLWKDLKHSAEANHKLLDGNFGLARDYLVARAKLRDTYLETKEINTKLMSAKFQRSLISAIEEKYGLKLKYVSLNLSSIKKDENAFEQKKKESDKSELEKNREYHCKTIEEARGEYLREIAERGEFKEILSKARLFAIDVMYSSNKDSNLYEAAGKITKIGSKFEEALEERRILANKILDNWDGHVGIDVGKATKNSLNDSPTVSMIMSNNNINYRTIEKHADRLNEKHYFKETAQKTLGDNSDYGVIMNLIEKSNLKKIEKEDISILNHSCDRIIDRIDSINEHIDNKKSDRQEIQNDLNHAQFRIKEINHYNNTEFPNFIEGIYNEDETETIKKLDGLLEKTNEHSQLITALKNNPEMLGYVRKPGIIDKMFNRAGIRDLDYNMSRLEARFKTYIGGVEEMKQLENNQTIDKYGQELAKIDKEINMLRSFLPNDMENNVIEKITETRNHSNDIESDAYAKKINKLLQDDKMQDASFNYQMSNNILFEHNKKQRDFRIQESKLATQDHAQIKKINKVALNKSDQKQDPELSFDKVKSQLDREVIIDIFEKYAPLINPDGKVKQNSSHISSGSINMSLSLDKQGLWKRFSDNSKGDIFEFVKVATESSKKEALEIVAAHIELVSKGEHKIHDDIDLLASLKQSSVKNTEKSIITANKKPQIAQTIITKIESLIDFEDKNGKAIDDKIILGNIRSCVMSNLKDKGLHENPIYLKRLEHEFDVISKSSFNKTSFAKDFALAGGVAAFSKANNIAIGAGRGSAVSSLVAYGLGIHDVDPIKYDLLFERFLTKETQSMPDFDIDIARNKKEIVENWLFAKYQDAAKITVNHKNGNNTTHPASIILLGYELQKEHDIKMVQLSGKTGFLFNRAMIDKNKVEEMGVRKIDLLSSKVIENINYAESLLEKDNCAPDWDKINWNDEKTFELLNSDNLEGIYQLGGKYASSIAPGLKIKDFNDIITTQALVRPGASKSADDFKNGINGKIISNFSDPKKIFAQTRGVILFQEQIMEAGVKYLGVDKDKSNDFRKELSLIANLQKDKNSNDIDLDNNSLARRNNFIKAAINAGGLTRQDASNLYNKMLNASSYGFNKSHAVAYSMVSFKTAYIKAHYPDLFKEIFIDGTKKESAIIYDFNSTHKENIAANKEELDQNLHARDANAILEKAKKNKNNIASELDPKKDEWIAHGIIPERAEKFNPSKHFYYLEKDNSKITNCYEYRNENNQRIGYTIRIEQTRVESDISYNDQTGEQITRDIEITEKKVMPVTYCYNEAKGKSAWRLKGFTDEGYKAIYNCDKLKSDPYKPVLIVEGEKTADAASELFPDHTVISWMGGVRGIERVNWSVLDNRLVTIWQDNDTPGIEAAGRIKQIIDENNGFAGATTIIDTKSLNLPEKWDLADKLPEDAAIKSVDQALNRKIFIKDEHSFEEELANSNEYLKEKQNDVSDTIDTLSISGRIQKDEYLSKDMYQDIMLLIARDKNIDLNKNNNINKLIKNMRTVQEEYQNKRNDFDASQEGENTPTDKEQFHKDMVCDASVLHQLQSSTQKITDIHKEAITEIVQEEIGKMKSFEDSHKIDVANNIYKTIKCNNWLEEVEKKTQEKIQNITLNANTKTIDEFLSSSNLTKDEQKNLESHLTNIRHYEADEKNLLNNFKEDTNNGASNLVDLSQNLSSANKSYNDHKYIIKESRDWGYNGTKNDTIKSIAQLDKIGYFEVKNYCQDIRDTHISGVIEKQLDIYNQEKSRAKSLDKLVPIIDKEQTFLAKSYKSLKSPITDYDYNIQSNLSDSKEYKPRLITDLNDTAKKLISDGIKTESEIITRLQNATSIKSEYKKLDIELEKTTFERGLRKIRKEKFVSDDPKEVTKGIIAEKKYYASYYKKLKYPGAIREKDLSHIKDCYKNRDVDTEKNLHKLTALIAEQKSHTPEQVRNYITGSNNAMQAEHLLKLFYHEHVMKDVHHCLKSINEGRTIKVHNERFKCPLQFLDKVKDISSGHAFFPHEDVNKLHTEAIEHQKHEQHLEKSHTPVKHIEMDGPSM